MKSWNPKRAEDFIALLKTRSGDPEAAHGYEDDNYHSFIEAIAAGQVTDPMHTAAIILTSKSVDFERWCA